MIVEDQPQIVRLVTEVLKAVGYDVISTVNNEKAVETVAVEQPSLIILDVMFPQGIDGFEICRRIRQFSDTPVIMLTAKVKEQDKLSGFDAGADDYLTKPFSQRTNSQVRQFCGVQPVQMRQ